MLILNLANRLAPQINVVSRERVREELTKMLTEGHARRAFELLDETGLLNEVLPEIANMRAIFESSGKLRANTPEDR